MRSPNVFTTETRGLEIYLAFLVDVNGHLDNFNALYQRFLTCGPRTPGGPRLLWKLNNLSQQIDKACFEKNQNLKLKILKRPVKVKEFEIGGYKLSWYP
jgi:hypothetical protein